MSSRLGDVAEFLFDAKSVEMGLIVNRPIHAGTVYDRIIDNGQAFFRVQIKSIWNAKKTAGKPRVYFRRSQNNAYDSNHVDVYAIYVKNCNNWYIIPYTDVNTMLLGDLYKENWRFFEKV